MRTKECARRARPLRADVLPRAGDSVPTYFSALCTRFKSKEWRGGRIGGGVVWDDQCDWIEIDGRVLLGAERHGTFQAENF